MCISCQEIKDSRQIEAVMGKAVVMERTVNYVYAYHEGKRIRNAGFVRRAGKEGNFLLILQLRGITPSKMLKVYALFEEEEEGRKIFLKELSAPMPVLSIQLELNESSVETYSTPQEIKGILIEDDEGRTYIGLWEQVAFDSVQIFPARQRREPKETAKPEVDAEVPAEESAEKEEDGGTLAIEKDEGDDGALAVEKDEEDDGDLVIENEGNVAAEQEDEEEEQKLKEQSMGEIGWQKITREDIGRFPRCEWRLVNNPFLMHGYRNYHYLALSKEDGKTILGVPGVYAKQEEQAARAFGFTMFRRAKEAQEEDENFGYWCRFVRTEIV